MRILVIGAGAVGGYFGAKLQRAGRDVTFLVRGKRAEQLRSGLHVTEPEDTFTVTPKLVSAEELRAQPETFELILLATKTYALAQAMEDFAPAVGEGTAILPLLNGMQHVDALSERFGREHVLGGATRISADLDDEGRVTSMDKKLHDLHFGELDGAMTERSKAIDAELSGTGIANKLEKDIVHFMWNKWTVLSALAATTCLLRGSVGEIVAVTGGAETATAILAESAAIAAANGYPASPEFLDGVRGRLTETGSALTASMYRDLMRGAQVESEPVFGDLLARGRAKGVDAPLLTAAFVQLSVYLRGLTS